MIDTTYKYITVTFEEWRTWDTKFTPESFKGLDAGTFLYYYKKERGFEILSYKVDIKLKKVRIEYTVNRRV